MVGEMVERIGVAEAYAAYIEAMDAYNVQRRADTLHRLKEAAIELALKQADRMRERGY